MTAGGGVEVLAVMAEAEQIGKHARIAVTADGDLPAARRAFERIANKLEGAGKARTAIAELIAADKKVMAKHDADAQLANFARCGCDYCDALRPILNAIEGAA